jgi:Dockerin type I domain
VTASDATSPLAAPPTVTVVDSASASMTVTYDGESPAGTFNYHVVVASTTANGAATISASVSDSAGNSESATARHFNINKDQITGQIALESFLGASRDVTFKATGGTAKTWTLTLSFSGGVASYTLTDVPAATTGISAKTAWNLRQKLAVTLDGDGQATGVNFTGADKLLGGDINGDNFVNILDYSVLKNNWYTSNAVADIDGDGSVQLTDYSLLKANFFKRGDAE